ncbi:2-phytyl-1,4-beta-naphthoquinone methyltransferase, chloroplastic-like isoform X2 [Telopea speciosissima]|uniref:2-phytyl-1,4-beta-naphthoquinone methyltransferase, chloroplastic-like isoform X2 n=1 Tax=Telopea speciosissima TaxID=54955 RepID=UPI001CC7BA6A|nr:2-phytyl-1,4-beta-naphthoquinone methyltransferase, chloroplastic-like isoform X2 [Telopea speciosissima]
MMAVAATASLKPTSSCLLCLRPRTKLPAGYRPVLCAIERQALFNRIAPVYDNLNDLLSLGQHRVWKRMAVSWSGAKEGDCVLDLCCGSGDLAFLLSQKVTGLDFSKEQLFIAASRQGLLWKPFYKNIVWIEGDALDLPFPDCHFDAITVGYGLRNLVDRNKAMKGMLRVLKPGHFILSLSQTHNAHTRISLLLFFPGARVSILDFNKSSQLFTSTVLEWMIDNVVIPVASSYGLAEEYTYLKSSIREFLTGRELETLALEAGFSDAKHYEIGGGLMGNLVAMR